MIAHRGASAVRPENTLAAFAAACEMGAPYIELDVHMTADAVVVVCHDADLLRTAGAKIAIAQTALEAVRRADVGATFSADGEHYPFRGQGLKVPTLAEVLAAWPDRRFVVEIKQTAPSLVAPLLEVVESLHMTDKVLIASEHQEPLDELRALAPAVPTNFSRFEVARFMQALAAGQTDFRPPGQALQVPPSYEGFALVTPASVDFAHRLGVEVDVWTVNEVDEMKAMLALGADGIITDCPDRMFGLLAGRAERC